MWHPAGTSGQPWPCVTEREKQVASANTYHALFISSPAWEEKRLDEIFMSPTFSFLMIVIIILSASQYNSSWAPWLLPWDVRKSTSPFIDESYGLHRHLLSLVVDSFLGLTTFQPYNNSATPELFRLHNFSIRTSYWTVTIIECHHGMTKRRSSSFFYPPSFYG